MSGTNYIGGIQSIGKTVLSTAGSFLSTPFGAAVGIFGAMSAWRGNNGALSTVFNLAVAAAGAYVVAHLPGVLGSIGTKPVGNFAGHTAKGPLGWILNPIARYESGFNPDVIFGGDMPFIMDGKHISQSTIGEVAAWQDAHGNVALGKYGFKNVGSKARKLGMPFHWLFDGDMHDQMAIRLMEEKGLKQTLEGKMPVTTFMRGLSDIWAVVPEDTTGVAALGGIAGNPKIAAIKPAGFLQNINKAVSGMQVFGPDLTSQTFAMSLMR